MIKRNFKRKNDRKILKAFINCFIVTALVLALLLAMHQAVEKQNKIDCLKYQKWSYTYSEFYLLEWQKEMCDSYQVEIKAPVRK